MTGKKADKVFVFEKTSIFAAPSSVPGAWVSEALL
jgi:hypothetical protein